MELHNSVFHPVLFNVTINDIFECTGQGYGLSLFADDGAMWKRGAYILYLKIMTKQIQEALNKVAMWANKWRFKISAEKNTLFKFYAVWLDERHGKHGKLTLRKLEQNVIKLSI